MEFASPAWSPWLEGDKKKLEAVQERAIKMISGLKGKTYEEKCRELGLETLEERRDRQDMAEVHRMMQEEEKESRRGVLQVIGTRGGTTTRRAADSTSLQKQYARTDTRKYSFGLRVKERWNSMDSGIREETDGKVFKRRLKLERKRNQ